MARTIPYWYDIIVGEKNTMANLNTLQPSVATAQTLLNDVTSDSRVARWRLWIWAVAVCAYTLDVLFDLLKIDLLDIVSRTRYGSLRWYAAIAKDYQNGDSLVWINNRYQYATINDAAKIIKRSAAIENPPVVNLKVATLVGTTVTPLISADLIAFSAYINQVRPPGILVHIISDNPDELRLFVNVVFDPLVLRNTGESIAFPGTYPIEDSINNYITNLDFNGVLELCKVVDAMQLASGCISAYVTSASARYGTNPFVAFTERYTANAGHLCIDTGTPLNSSINYQANV